MIGNIYEKDIVGAKDIGMHTILFNENNVKDIYQKADFIVNSMYDIISIVEKINTNK